MRSALSFLALIAASLAAFGVSSAYAQWVTSPSSNASCTENIFWGFSCAYVPVSRSVFGLSGVHQVLPLGSFPDWCALGSDGNVILGVSTPSVCSALSSYWPFLSVSSYAWGTFLVWIRLDGSVKFVADGAYYSQTFADSFQASLFPWTGWKRVVVDPDNSLGCWIKSDGTSNCGSGTYTDVTGTVDSYNVFYYALLRSDWTVETNKASLSSFFAASTWKRIYFGWSSRHWSDWYAWEAGGIRSDDTIAFSSTVSPSWTFSSIQMRRPSDGNCAVSTSNVWVCFNPDWTPSSTSDASPPPSSGSPLGEYCIESPTASGSYVFTPLNTYWPVTTDSSFFGWWESFSTSAIDYKFFHLDFEYRQYLTGALLNTNTVEAFSFVSSDMAPVFDASVEIVSKSGSVNYLRVFGDTHWNPVEYSAILEDSDWNRTYKVAYTRTDMGKYLMYEGSWNVVWWRLRFPDFDTDVTVKRFEIGNREYVSSSVTRVTCYTKEEHDQLVNNPQFDPNATGSLASVAVGMSTYVGIQNGGSWTWTNGELYERVFSGSQDYLNTNPPENYTKIVSTYFTKCEAPEADLGGFSFLSWWFEWTVPVVNYSFDFRPFVGVECPLRVVVANYETLKWLLYNR